MTSQLLIFTITLTLMTSAVTSQCPAKCICKQDSTVLDCSEQDLTKVPDAPYSDVIFSLDLSRNRIPILRNSSFADRQIYTLTSLIIRDSPHLSDIESQAFRGLSSLRTLDLSGNDLAALDSGVFKTLINLDTLILDRNPLHLPAGFEFRSLHSLSMISCRLTNIPSTFFETTPKLTYLNLTSNQLTSFDSQIVSSLATLESLDISRNQLTNPREAMHQLPVSVKNFETLKNPWNCDCDLKNIESSYATRLIDQEFMCSTPAELKNHVITADVISKVECVVTTEAAFVFTEEVVEEEVVEEEVVEEEEDTEEEFDLLPQADIHVDNSLEDVVQDEKSGKIQVAPELVFVEKEDRVVGAGAGGGVDVTNWAADNQWWLVGGAAFAVMLGVIVMLQVQVRRFGRRQLERERDPELEHL